VCERERECVCECEREGVCVRERERLKCDSSACVPRYACIDSESVGETVRCDASEVRERRAHTLYACIESHVTVRCQ